MSDNRDSNDNDNDNDNEIAELKVNASSTSATSRIVCEKCANDRFFAESSANDDACLACSKRALMLICTNCNLKRCASCAERPAAPAVAVAATSSSTQSVTISAERGYIAATGPAIERAAARFLGAVPQDWVLNRQRRDGGAKHHITLLSRMDLNGVAASRAEVVRAFSETLVDGGEPFQVLGVGSAVSGDSIAVFVVVDWPQMHAVRDKFGLARHDPHITLGFKRADIHGVSKNVNALISDDVDVVTERLAALKRGGGGGGRKQTQQQQQQQKKGRNKK